MDKPQRPSSVVKFGSQLLLKVGYLSPQIRVSDTGQVLVGVFTDRLREYPTDWTFEEAESALREHERLEREYQEATRRI
ncbi:hypothetical protein A5742_31405 [Mycolicibacterium fortuitum]|uniref:Uncharacterized protein n=1 Tax=Mycolicibacterium fortuitum TaxID=1766 RepID=A0ABD6QJ46_MYCFO|nr:hypothetical protein [Mycolicibacterium fortuitum]OMC41889.1 hypothetical protein A5742_31405 [Mycolicibacterium fortuitum]